MIATFAVNLEALRHSRRRSERTSMPRQTKLAAARIGENLEKNQQSEKLEIIEQPTTPQSPVRPNRPKLAGMAILLAAAAGAGLAFVVELADKAIRRSSDVFAVVDSRMVVSIPYISTPAELRRREHVRKSIIVAVAVIAVGAVVAAYLLLPLDLIDRKGAGWAISGSYREQHGGFDQAGD